MGSDPLHDGSFCMTVDTKPVGKLFIITTTELWVGTRMVAAAVCNHTDLPDLYGLPVVIFYIDTHSGMSVWLHTAAIPVATYSFALVTINSFPTSLVSMFIKKEPSRMFQNVSPPPLTSHPGTCVQGGS